MHFTFEGKEYWIEFHYDTKRKGRKQRNYTTCKIVTGNRGEDKTLVTEGTVVRYQYDDYDKEEARKYALDKALATSERNFRTAARTTYHTRPGGLGWKPVQVNTATK